MKNKLISIKCPLCNKSEYKTVFYKDSFRIVRCNTCSLIYVNPRISRSESIRLYNENAISPVNYYKETEKEDKITFEKRLNLIEKFTKNKGKILDIGCSIGTLLDLARNKGFDCYGIEINKDAAKICKKKNLRVYQIPIEKCSFNKNFFDLIIMNDIIEHLHNPKEVMDMVSSILKPNGILFMVTPDIGSFTSRLLGKYWHHLKPNEHLVYFSESTIKRLLNQCNFNVEMIRHLGRYRKVETIMTKPKPSSRFVGKIIKFIPMSIKRIIVPFNLCDELGIIARKSNSHKNL